MPLSLIYGVLLQALDQQQFLPLPSPAPTSLLPLPAPTYPLPLSPTTISTHPIVPTYSNPPIPTNTHTMQTRSKSGIFKPRLLNFNAYTITPANPISYIQHWCSAMAVEFNALQAQGTWSPVPRSHQI